MLSRQQLGKDAETRAVLFLQARGLRILARNFRVRGGEIDIVCRDGATTVFVEVRHRGNPLYGGAAASITGKKQARIVLAAQHWLLRHGETPCRFDCVLEDRDEMRWQKNAFTT